MIADILVRILLIAVNISIIIICVNELIIRQKIKQLEDKLNDYQMTPEEKELYKK